MSRLGSVRVGGTNPVRVMGIINTSPESFFKSSVFVEKKQIAKIARQMEEAGADLVDVGGMSTAPYLKTMVPEGMEIMRVTKAIEAIQGASNLPISVDTCRAGVARAAFDLGVDILNDVTGMQYDDGMASVLEEYGPSVIVSAFSKSRVAGDDLSQTRRLLRKGIGIARKSGITRERIVVDPAIGFFRKKAPGHFFTKTNSDWFRRDVTILQNLKSIRLGYPMLISVSRKSFIGKILGENDPSKRLAGSLAAETIAVMNGIDVIRTHNVKETFDAIQVAQKLKTTKGL